MPRKAKIKDETSAEIKEKFGIQDTPISLPKIDRPKSEMKIFNVEQRTPEWHSFRNGKVMGTKLKGIMGRTRDEWIKRIAAERLSVWTQDETDLERGIRLEDEARFHFEEKTGIKVTTMGVVTRSDNLNMASSPDGLVYDEKANEGKGTFTGGVEIKCLMGWKHLMAILGKLDCLENDTPLWDVVPEEYKPQSLQYFIVNDYMEVLYFVFYSEDIAECPMVVLKILRSDIESEIERAREMEISALGQVENIVDKIVFLSDEHKEFMYQ